MKFHHQYKRNTTTPLFVKIIFIFVFLLIIWRIDFISGSLTRILSVVAIPVWESENYIVGVLKEFSLSLVNKNKLIKENNVLKGKVNVLESRLYSRDLLFQENNELKKILGRQTVNRNMLFGKVLTKPNKSPYDILIIDIGIENGVNVEDIVFAYGDIPIGTIVELTKNSAKVKLFSSSREEKEILIGEKHISTIAVGMGGGNFKAEIPRGIEIKEGDIISLPSIYTEVFGIVEKVYVSQSNSFQTVLFKSPVNFYELQFIGVLMLSNQEL